MTELGPESVTVKVCPVCGRNDRYTPFTGKSHFAKGERCPGQPVAVTYNRA